MANKLMRMSAAPLLQLLLWSSAIVLSSSTHATTTTTETLRLRVRGLAEFHSHSGKYRNPCTGKWSNDIEVLDIKDCDGENAGSSGSGLSGGSSNHGGGAGNDRGDIGQGGDGSDYDCSIQHNDDPTSPTVYRRVEYWYCVDSNSTNSTQSWLPILDAKIFEIAKDRLTWCIGYPVRRRLQEAANEYKRRKLGVLGVSPQPTDIVRSDVRYYKDCQVVQGGLTIQAREADDLNNTIRSMLYEVEDAMIKDKLLGEDIPDVTKVTYLGTSQEEVENAGYIPAIVGSTRGADEQKDDDGGGGVIIGICGSLLLLAIVLLLLLVRRKRKNESADRFLVLADDGQGFKPLPGTGDPPGSFHHGVHHYFRSGQNYLSTNCYDCHETRMLSNSDFGGVLPPTVEKNSNDDAYYNKLITPNIKDIGNGHSGMNVHKCTSSTCNICLADSKKEVVILKVERDLISRSQPRAYDDNVGVAHSTYDL